MTELFKSNALNKIIADALKKIKKEDDDIVESAGHRWRLDTDDTYKCIDCGMWTCSRTDFKSIDPCTGKDEK